MTRSSLRRGSLAAIACTALVALFSLADENYFGAEWLLRDWVSARLASRRTPDPRIVIVAISEKTTRVLAADYGRPQSYTRALYAAAVDELRRAGAKVVVFDLLFAEPNPADPEGDRQFAEAVGTMPVILGAHTEPLKKGEIPVRLPDDYFSDAWRVTGLWRPAMNAIAPHPMFRGAAGIGTMRMQSDSFSNVHSYVLVDNTSLSVPSLALEAYRAWANIPRQATWTRQLNGGYFDVRGLAIPTDRAGNLTIRWKGAKESRTALRQPAVDFDKVVIASMAHDDPTGAGFSAETLAEFEEQFRGRIVLVGQTATGLDLRSTPLSPTSAGIEIHANALDNMINGEFDVVVNRWVVFPFIAMLAALFGIVIDSRRSQVASAAITVGVIAIVLAAIYASAAAGWILPAFAALATVILTYITITVINFVAEQQQTAVLKTTFGRYVSPQILDHILAHPEKVQLGGERRDLTILFSDIRGFTSISEASEPEQVVDMLNEYLTRMVEILLDHGGTLDKFIGDAVMGFWNAPAADPDHPHHAVACAIEMIEETAKLRERWISEGKAALRIGIGVNTGDAVVGNIGAEKVFGYTVIGDAVNLASRLEGKNKDYGTEIIISEFTRERIGDAFQTVYLDEVKVKGKEKAVKIYEVRGARSAAGDAGAETAHDREVSTHA